MTQAIEAVPAVNRGLRVLLLEDKLVDAELIVRELRRSGFDPDWRRVETEAEFLSNLNPSLDLILADFRLPRFDGLRALRRVQERGLEIPFIVISGALGDELAARCIKEGVTDYLLKDRLERLGLAVARALEEKQMRAERLLIERQLRQAQNMELVGQLAGGIAHDFNNVLAIINGWTSLLLEEEFSQTELHETLREIFSAGQRAAGLTRQLLYFSRKRSIDRYPLDLNVVIEEVSTMLRRLIGDNIKLELELSAEKPVIEADAGMMEQVLMNLAVNARDAMAHGGKLVISSRILEISEAEARETREARPGRFARLRVEDTGCGIAPETLPRIFEPFFTTKEVGRGTGLGLATVFGIVKDHRGWIEVASEIGAGTAFNIFLPAAASLAVEPVKPNLPLGRVAGGGETVLAVEDEPSVGDFIVAVLKPYGYRVLRASSGDEALEVWKQHIDRIDLLLTDVVMPGDLTGPELAAKLLAAKPNLAVILSSAYDPEAMAGQFTREEDVRFIQKPFPPRLLAKLVREVLDRRARRKLR